MHEQPTEESFAKHLNTKFSVRADAPRPIELELIEVNGWTSRPEEEKQLERFSVTFRGPEDIYMEQHTYTLEHEHMGVLEIFLVPIGRDENGFTYQAVYNYFKK
jgi:hypothetical protein